MAALWATHSSSATDESRQHDSHKQLVIICTPLPLIARPLSSVFDFKEQLWLFNRIYSLKISALHIILTKCCGVVDVRIHQPDLRHFILAKWSPGIFGQFTQLPWQQEFFTEAQGLWLDAFHFAFTNQRLGFGPIRLSLLCRVVIMQSEGMSCRAWWAGIPSPKLHTDTNYMYRRQPCHIFERYKRTNIKGK